MSTIKLDSVKERLVNPEIIDTIVRTFQQNHEETRAKSQKSREKEDIITVLSCADSRVLPANFLSDTYEEIFGIRNVANTTVPLLLPNSRGYTPQGLEIAAGIEHAIHQGSKKLIVVGHTDCGGAEAILTAGGGPKLMSYLETTSAAAAHKTNLKLGDETPQLISHDLKSNAPYLYECARSEVERTCLHSSVDTIRQMPFVADAIKNEQLSLVGIMHDIRNARLIVSGDQQTSKELEMASELSVNFETYKARLYGENGTMPDLVEFGQHPKSLIITGTSPDYCPENMGIKEGDALVHRRLGGKGTNFQDNVADSLCGTIEFAVEGKGVETIAIIGKNKGVYSEYMNTEMSDTPISKAFIESCVPDIIQWKKEGRSLDAVQQDCLRSTFNSVMEHSSVKKAVQDGTLSVVALLADYDNGEILYLNPDNQKFSAIEQFDI